MAKHNKDRTEYGKRSRGGNIAALLLTLLALILIAGAVYAIRLSIDRLSYTDAYIAGRTPEVKVYSLNEGYRGSNGDSATDAAGGADTADTADVSDAADNTGTSGTSDVSDAADNTDTSGTSDVSDAADSAGADGFADTGDLLIESGTLVRGTAVKRYNKTVTYDGEEYCLIETGLSYPDKSDQIAEAESAEDEDTSTVDNEAADDSYPVDIDTNNTQLYIRTDNLTETRSSCVQEEEVYVRTPVTVYAGADGPEIASFAPKGTCLEVTGYDELLDDGSISKYKVRYGEDGEEGFVYGKYMAASEKSALRNYNENGEYSAAKKDKFRFELYGGSAKHLDYYPYEKTEIGGNDFLRDARAMYINTEAAINTDPYVKLINETDCNAVVIDIKDGPLTYKSPVAKKYSPNSYKKAYASMEDFRKGVEAYRKTGAYLIGRIVVFNDTRYAKDHPEDCIKYKGKTNWPSAYSRDVWEYNVSLAREAVREFGFNEIQFDYVRFPESSYDMSKSGSAKFRNKYGEEKAQAIQNFCFYAADQLREEGAYISVDVFGESAYSYVTAYGQYWMAISNIVDAISAMPYTDHFSADKAWEKPYGSVLNWARYAEKQQGRLQDPAAARTWITGYDTPYWGPTVKCDAKYLRKQIKALKKAGLDGGFIPWNVLSSTSKYELYKDVWNK